MLKNIIIVLSFLTLTPQLSIAVEVAPLYSQVLPEFTTDQEVQMLTVTYAPGEKSDIHRHDAHSFLYVLEGSIRTQVRGDALVTLEKGDTYYESPENIHIVSENASTTAPATFLVFFVKPVGGAILEPAK